MIKILYTYLLALLFSFSISGWSASPVTHIYLANDWLATSISPLEDEEYRNFLIGTLFPDIRYLNAISRNETHEVGVTLSDIFLCPIPFEAGKKLHSFVDEKREELVEEWNIYTLLPDIAEGHKATLLKLIEDEILFEKIDRAKVITLLQHIPEEEIASGIPIEVLEMWHSKLRHYFKQRPSALFKALAMEGKPFFDIPPHLVAVWSVHIPILAAQPEFMHYVDQLTHEFYFIFKGMDIIQKSEFRIQDSE